MKVVINIAAGFIFVGQRISGHAVRAVYPPGQILKLAALAAKWLPRRLRSLAAAEHAQALSHPDILWRDWLKAQGLRLIRSLP
jgi:hypothetical protein